MSKNERIKELERKVAELERRPFYRPPICPVCPSPWWDPWPYRQYDYWHYTITCGDSTGDVADPIDLSSTAFAPINLTFTTGTTIKE